MCCYAEEASVEMSRPASRASHHQLSGLATAGNCISSRPEFPQPNIVPRKSQTPVVRHPSTFEHQPAARISSPSSIEYPSGQWPRPQTIEPRRHPKVQHRVAPDCPLGRAKQPAEPTQRPPSSRPSAEHPLCGPYRKPQLQRAPAKRDPTSSLSRASIKALRNPRNG